MFLKKIISIGLLLILLSGCAQNTALLGPAYTLSSTGNVLQAGLSYGTTYTVKKITGKTPSENAEIILKKIEKSAEKDENPKNFFKTVKKYIEHSKENDTYTIR